MKRLLLILSFLGITLKAGNYEEIVKAIQENRIETVFKLLCFIPDINKIWNGESLLPLAVTLRRTEIVKSLIDHGAKVNCVSTKFGYTPLQKAAFMGAEDIVKILIHEGADVNSIDNKGSTPLHAAVSSGNSNVIVMLINNGAHVDIKDNLNRTVFDMAEGLREEKRQQIVTTITSTKKRLEEAENSAHLLKAIRDNNVPKAKELLKQNIDINRLLNGSESLLHMVVLNGSKEMLKLLIDHGADINKVDNDGNAVLHHAVAQGACEIVQILIDAGVDPFIGNKENKIAFEIIYDSYLYDSYLITDLLANYMPLYTESQKPAENTLSKIVELGYPGLVKQILKKVPVTIEQLYEYSKIAHDQFNKTKKDTYKAVGQIMLRAIIRYTLLYKKLMGANLPGDIARIIAHMDLNLK
ncbi:ankyrin repeat domain-containing protein [Candidatus Dependentiae bacterium]|nr:ankyrin repeat domain-containing protein [Candidatus Dependentiae bacterium]